MKLVYILIELRPLTNEQININLESQENIKYFSVSKKRHFFVNKLNVVLCLLTNPVNQIFAIGNTHFQECNPCTF